MIALPFSASHAPARRTPWMRPATSRAPTAHPRDHPVERGAGRSERGADGTHSGAGRLCQLGAHPLGDGACDLGEPATRSPIAVRAASSTDFAGVSAASNRPRAAPASEESPSFAAETRPPPEAGAVPQGPLHPRLGLCAGLGLGTQAWV